MAERTKVCLVTGVSGFVGQHILASLVSTGHKVLAVGEAEEAFSPSILNEENIKITTALPISATAFKRNDVQYCFGDIADISFLASIFATAENRGIDIEFVLHLACCNSQKVNILKSAQVQRKNYEGTANILETAHAYWQDHSEIFHGFFYASNLKKDKKQEQDPAKKLIKNLTAKDDFPSAIYQFSQVYGPGDLNNSRIVPGTLYRLLYCGTDNSLVNKFQGKYNLAGSLYQNTLYIKNLTHAVNLLLDHMSKENNLDLIAGEEFDVEQATDYFLTYGKKKPTASEMTEEIQEKRQSYLKLNRAVGYMPRYTIESGFNETARWYKSHQSKN